MRTLRFAVALVLVLLVGVGAGFALGRGAPATGPAAWREAAPLAAPRAHLNAVALATGDILVVGGLDPAREAVLGSTELIEPRTGADRVVPAAIVPRIDASVSALPSGLLVVTGGSERRAGGAWSQMDVTELFDPWSGRWWRGEPMLHARADHGATVLRDGRVLVAGGHDGPRMLDTVEIFDPRTERWTPAAPLPAPRQQFSIATLPNGMVLVAGGLEARGQPSRTSLLYDPVRGTWSRGPDLSTARVLHSTVVLANGDVLLVGGQKAASGSAERYDVRLGKFVLAGTLEDARELAQVAATPDGGAIVVGGIAPRDFEFAPIPSVEVYDPATNAWTPGPDTEQPSAFGGLVTTGDGVWLIGGSGPDERALDRVVRLP